MYDVSHTATDIDIISESQCMFCSNFRPVRKVRQTFFVISSPIFAL